MNTSSVTPRIALFSAAAAAALWTAKSVAIALAGGLDRSPAESPLFFLGLIASLVAVSSLLLIWTFGRPWPVRLLAALAGLPALFLLVLALETMIEWVQPAHPGWVWSEISLWVVAAGLLGAAIVVRRQSGRGAIPAHVHQTVS